MPSRVKPASSPRPPLTKEREIELAERIAAANDSVFQAIARSPDARDELARLADELRDGEVEASDLVLFATDAESDRERIGAELLEAVRRRPAGADRAGARSSEAVLSSLRRYGMSHSTIATILDRLESARETRPASKRKALDASIATIRAGRTTAESARAIFVEANVGLVMTIAAKRRLSGLPMQDLVQEGCIGLMRAVEMFDPHRGFRFSTYATWWIRHAINRAISDKSRTIRLPVHLLETQYQVTRSANKFSLQHGREPTEAELVHQTGLPLGKIRLVAAIPKNPSSMDAPLGAHGGGDARLGDFIAAPESGSPGDEMDRGYVRYRLQHLLTTLPPREAELLRLRFGMDGAKPLSLQQIGERFSLSRERVRQLETVALSKLKRQADDLANHLES